MTKRITLRNEAQHAAFMAAAGAAGLKAPAFVDLLLAQHEAAKPENKILHRIHPAFRGTGADTSDNTIDRRQDRTIGDGAGPARRNT